MKYQYKTVSYPIRRAIQSGRHAQVLTRLNALGEMGWKIIDIVFDPTVSRSVTFFLMREYSITAMELK